MDNNSPSNNKLPSAKKLLKSTILAIISAALILVTTVLPAEYGVDPSGVGAILGLKKMGEIKVSLAEEAASLEAEDESQSNSSAETVLSHSDVFQQKGEITITLNPNEGGELKVYMKKGGEINYKWWTDGAEVRFDAHTDAEEYDSYSAGVKVRDVGILKAVCDGRHGWWWKNRTSDIVSITLKVEGMYSDFKEES